MEYDSSGQSFKTIDPAGSESRQFFDDAGRTTKTIQNYTDGNPSTGGADEDVTVETTYGSDSQVLTLTAKNSTIGDQTTTYVYGTTLADSDIARADLLRAEIYPDSDDVADPLGNGADGVYDRVEYTYNRLGQPTTVKDQNGSVHTYTFDALGRETEDAITTLAAGVDGAVRRISKAYEVRGMVDTITSHDAASGGNVVNQSVFEFDDSGLLSKEYQQHEGAKDGSTLYVQYNSDTTASGGEYTKGLRPASVRYPNGRLVHTTYGASDSTADAINRLDAIKDDSGGSPGSSLAEYSYLGGGRIVKEDFTEPDVRLDYAAGAGDDPYDGLDRFGRVVDLLWRDYGSSADAVRIQHGYDRAGSRLYREDPVAAANSQDFDELYAYDGAYQLTDFDRGNLNGAKDGLVAASLNFAQEWSLDPTGNWTTFKQDDDGDSSWNLNQSRTHNKINEITQIAASDSHVAYDRNGAMTKTPKPGNWSAHFDLTYDGWNRLVKVVDGGATVAGYEYDGRDFRVVKKTYDGGQLDETRRFFYNDEWQILEERVDTSTNADRHFIWGVRYIDDLILRDRDTSNPANGTLNERLYALQDPNWNVVGVVNTNGSVQERYAYNAYGEPEFLTPAFQVLTESGYLWETLFAAYRYNAEVAWYHVRNRDLFSHLGVWHERDPIASDANLYRYVANSPTNAMDPNGLWVVLPGGGDNPTDEGRGIPAHRNSASTGHSLRFIQQGGDGPYLIQEVEVEGRLWCQAKAEGEYNYNIVNFKYSFTEAFKFYWWRSVRRYQTAIDKHYNSPEHASLFVNSHCPCKCDFIKPWGFTSTATFVAFSGFIRTERGPFNEVRGFTPVVVETTWSCASDEGMPVVDDEARTVHDKTAVMDMYPGKDRPDPVGGSTRFSRAKRTQRGERESTHVDSWACDHPGGPGLWECRHSSEQGYQPPEV